MGPADTANTLLLKMSSNCQMERLLAFVNFITSNFYELNKTVEKRDKLFNRRSNIM